MSTNEERMREMLDEDRIKYTEKLTALDAGVPIRNLFNSLFQIMDDRLMAISRLLDAMKKGQAIDNSLLEKQEALIANLDKQIELRKPISIPYSAN